MEEIYINHVFFECQRSLSGNEKKRVQIYFSVRRKSGGGDCGPLTPLADNFYRISFRHQEDQQEVLKRSEHVIELADGSLVISVRNGLPTPASCENITSTTPAESPQFNPVSAASPSNEEYELCPDEHLPSELKECVEAEEQLEEEVPSASCSVQLHPEEDSVSFKKSSQPDAVDEVGDWKAELDSPCDSYLCHPDESAHKYEGQQVRDEGMASSIAGLNTEGRSQVNTKLLDVEDKSCFSENISSLSLTNTEVASYSLCDGLQVVVCQGDITTIRADALVNDANEDLKHCEGIAAALSQAGGPDIQCQSDALIKYKGKIPTCEVVVTTGGNLHCKRLMHAVGPTAGKAGGREKILLERTIRRALNLAEMMKFTSIALPCISSGVFGVPVSVCSEAIVTVVKEFGSQGGRSLSTIILIDDQEEVMRAMQEACDRLLGKSTGNHRVSGDPVGLELKMESSGQEAATGDANGGPKACDRLLLGKSTGNHTVSGDPVGLELKMESSGQEAATGDADGGPKGVVKVEIVQGTIETQQVDALVSPMVGNDPLSTRVGNLLKKKVGFQLIARFRRESGGETNFGESVLVEGLDGLPFNAVFFLNLAQWDEDENGDPVEVLRLGINGILNSCEERGIGSVAFPVIGAGIALRFPDSVVARVLLEEINKFEQNRSSNAPIVVRIVIYSSDEETVEVFRSVQESLKYKGVTQADQQDQNQESTSRRIVLLGKTGSGKSYLANTILGEELFTSYHSSTSGTQKVQTETRSVNGRSLTLIDTPGFFDTEKSEEVLKPEIMRCITECSPGPHVFLIVLKVEKFTKHEQDVIDKILHYFSDDALNYAVLVFTHGDNLQGMKIEEFVGHNKNLNALLKRCGGRCHVFDNKHWNNNQRHDYRNNLFQLEALLQTMDKMVEKKNGSCYTNDVLQHVEEKILKYEEHIRETSVNLTPKEIRKKAKAKVSNELLISLTATTTGLVLGAFFGVLSLVEVVMKYLKNPTEIMKLGKNLSAFAPAAVGLGSEMTTVVAAVAAGVTMATAAVAGGVIGGSIGSEVAKEAKSPMEAAKRTVEAVIETGKTFRTQHLNPR